MQYQPPDKRAQTSTHRQPSNASVDQAMLDLSAKLQDELEGVRQGSRRPEAAVEAAWRILRVVGLNDFGAIRSLRATEYPTAFEPHYAPQLSLALRTLGCLLYCRPSLGLDRAAQVLQRAVALAPEDPFCVEEFTDLACRLTPEDIRAFYDQPHKREETVIGYVRGASDATQRILERRFGILPSMINESSGASLQELLNSLQPEETTYVTQALSRLSWLCLEQALFFRKGGPLLSLAVATSCSHLQALGLPRGIMECVRVLEDALSSTSIVQALGNDLDPVCCSLSILASAFSEKARVYNNFAAARRSEILAAVLESINRQKAAESASGEA